MFMEEKLTEENKVRKKFGENESPNEWLPQYSRSNRSQVF